MLVTLVTTADSCLLSECSVHVIKPVIAILTAGTDIASHMLSIVLFKSYVGQAGWYNQFVP